MENKILYIKNMVCDRCIKVVKEELLKLNHTVMSIKLGEVTLSKEPDTMQLSQITESLEENGFELLDDKKSKVIEKVKNLVIELIYHKEQTVPPINYSEYLSQHIGLDYSYISSLFSSVESKTIEKYIISQKIERIKELIHYGELSVKEIADKLNYSSLQALSTQFKKETGLTPSEFKNLKENTRKSLDEI
jgi:AraC family transcriptional regulator